MNKSSTKVLLKTFFLITMCIVIALMNDIFARNIFPQFNRELRYADHFLAGFGLALIFYCIIRLVNNLLLWRIYKKIESQRIRKGIYSDIFAMLFSSLLSLYPELYWEYSQFIERKYFQYDQFIIYIIGIIVFFIYFNKFKTTYLNVNTFNKDIWN